MGMDGQRQQTQISWDRGKMPSGKPSQKDMVKLFRKYCPYRFVLHLQISPMF